MEALINYLIIGLVIGIFLIYIGSRLSNEINDNVLYGLFWMVYIITILVISNGILNFYFVKEINKKEGPKGDKGEKGEDGDEGIEAECDPNCKLNSMITNVIKKLQIKINEILQIERGKPINPPVKLNNQYIIQTIKRMCYSKEFKELSQSMHPTVVIDYILQLFYKWISLIATADKSEGKKHFQDYIEVYGEVVEWEFMVSPENNPFREIEKYDAFYWGLDKQFKPRVINSCSEPKPESTGPIKAIKTNLYAWRYNDKKTSANRDITAWVSEPIQLNDKTFYPLGQVFTEGYDHGGGGRFIEQLGAEQPFRYDFPGYAAGPSFTNVMVEYDPNNTKWVRKPPSSQWKWKWNDDGTKGKYDGSFYNLEDFEADGEKYKCFGSAATSYYVTPDINNIVCINEKALEKIDHQHQSVWNSNGAGKNVFCWLGPLPWFCWRDCHHQGSAYMNMDGTYNSGYLNNSVGPDYNRSTYKIKDEYLDKSYFGAFEAKQFTSKKEIPSDNQVGEGYQNPKYTHKQDRKGSLFDLLDLTMESYYINQSTKDRVRLKHSGTNIANCYLIYTINAKKIEKCISVYDNGSAGPDDQEILTDTCNPTKEKQLWEVEFVGDSSEKCLIKSLFNKKYLYCSGKNYFKMKGKTPSPSEPSYNDFVWKIIKS